MVQILKKLGMVDSNDLANYVLMKQGQMSHLKLQKLLYYIQAYHLANLEAKIIADDFEAWVHGPVSRKLFDKVKDLSLLYSEIDFKLEEGEADPREIIKG